MASRRVILCAVMAIFCAFSVRFSEGLKTWAPRCCRKGMHKAVISKGDPDVCNKDDLDRRSQFSRMERMICRWSERLCCMKEIQKLSCEHGKYTAFQGKSCLPRRAHIGGDHYVECCDCCKLGIKARTTNTSCSSFGVLLLPSVTNPCEKVFHECCSGGTIPPPGVTLPSKWTTPKPPTRGCAQKRCQHICREDINGDPMCYCRLGYSLTNDQETCVDVNECLRSPCSSGQQCENTPGSFRCVKTVPTQPSVCTAGLELRNGVCLDINECNKKPDPCGSDQKCLNTRGSYRCLCKKGYRAVGRTCVDIDECASGIAGCPPGQVCGNLPGTYICSTPGQCPPGKKMVQGTCVDVDECATGQFKCPSVARCVNVVGSYRCVPCQTGTKIKNNQCEDIDECANPNACNQGSRCINSFGSFRCVPYRCGAGQTYQAGRGCVDLDECSTGVARCKPTEYCLNIMGSYRCVACPAGNRVRNNKCVDIDECAEGTATCARGQVCQNTFGSYRCGAKAIQCRRGYEPSNGRCVDIDECRTGVARCKPGQNCVNTLGAYSCLPISCPAGHEFRDNKCQDVNECARRLSRCRADQYCVNTVGSYQCKSCQSGYRFQNGQCKDIDECGERRFYCPYPRTCKNTPGSYTCVSGDVSCRKGFKLINGKCQADNPCFSGQYKCPRNFKCVIKNGRPMCDDIDECTEKSNACFQGSTCINVRGSYRCVCPKGYKNVNNRRCEDKDECRLGVVCQHECRNTPGSFVCSCRIGFKLQSDGRSCKDINECKEVNPPCQHREGCRNTYGSYRCFCKTGYTLAADKRSCDDINECAGQQYGNTRNNPCQFQCLNTPGSYKCRCPQGYELRHGRNCYDIDECAVNPGICPRPNTVCRNAFGYHRCIPFECPPKYFKKENDNGCKLVDDCSEIRECAPIKEKGIRFYTFAVRNGEAPKKLFDYSLWTRGYTDPVSIQYRFDSGNDKGHFEIRRLSDNQVEIWTRIVMDKEAEYVLQFFGEVLVGGKLESRYRSTLYVFVSRYIF